MGRYDQAMALADSVTQRALDLISVAPAVAGPVVVNAGPAEAGGVVEVVLAGDEAPPGTQVGGADTSGDGGTDRRRRGHGPAARRPDRDGWLHDGRGTDATLTTMGDGVDLCIVVDDAAPPWVEMAAVMAEAWAQAGAHRHHPLRVRVQRESSTRVAARVTGIPGYGWAALDADLDRAHAVRAGRDWLDNGHVHIQVDAPTGTLALNGVAGFDRLVDGGDAGDTYNYSPPAHDTVVSEPDTMSAEVIETGPVRGRLRVVRTFGWPARPERPAADGTSPGGGDDRCGTASRRAPGPPYDRVRPGVSRPSAADGVPIAPPG